MAQRPCDGRRQHARERKKTPRARCVAAVWAGAWTADGLKSVRPLFVFLFSCCVHVGGKPAVLRVYGASKPCFLVFLLRACLRKACCPESLWGLETVVFPTRSHCLQLGLRCVHVSCLSIQTAIQRARVALVGTISSQHIFV